MADSKKNRVKQTAAAYREVSGPKFLMSPENMA